MSKQRKEEVSTLTLCINIVACVFCFGSVFAMFWLGMFIWE